jgi:hydrogenase maturation protease
VTGKPDRNETEEPPRIVVIGVGNLLLRDEGIGVHTVRALQDIDLPRDVTIIDGGTAPDLIAYSRAGDKLIIIDAARAGGEPGAIYRLHPEDLAPESGEVVSLHELGVEQSLRLMSLMGNEPAEIIILGVEPKEIEWGTELSAELQSKIPQIVRAVIREMGRDNSTERPAL